jgi:radical SAM superfamily enzyme YgiQ (UPF0313 family)
MKREQEGFPIVLTASAIEMSHYLNPFLAFHGGFPQNLPRFVEKRLYPPVPENQDKTAKFAPYGLRKVEALLVEEFGEDNVVTVHPSNLDEFIGSRTKVIGISTMDPMGLGFVSRTYTGILGLHRRPKTLVEFERLLSNKALKRNRPKIVVGGAGAWQLLNLEPKGRFGIDTIILGQAERSGVNLFRKAMNGEQLDRVVQDEVPEMSEVPAIRKPSIYGTVEITRGCGRGCHFCSPTMRKTYSFPLDRILSEARVNAQNGSRMIIVQTDDLFLYKRGPRFVPNGQAIVDLIKKIDEIPGVEFIQIAHASLPPIVHDPSIVKEIGPILVQKSIWRCGNERCASVEVGIETGSARLMEKHMKGKALPYEPEQWREIVVQAVGIMNDVRIYPLATLVLGLPGETNEDVQATFELIDKLKNSKLFYVPLVFVSEGGTALHGLEHVDVGSLSRLQWEIISTCWRQNIEKWESTFSCFAGIANVLPQRARCGALLAIYYIARKLHLDEINFNRVERPDN